jgi:uncharacterized membrane protein
MIIVFKALIDDVTAVMAGFMLDIGIFLIFVEFEVKVELRFDEILMKIQEKNDLIILSILN